MHVQGTKNFLQPMTRSAHLIRGFSLAEILVVLSIFALIGLTLTNGFQNYAHRQTHHKFVDEMFHSLNEQQQRSMAAESNKSHGVYIGPSTIEMFTGQTHIQGDPGNNIINIPDGTAVSSPLGEESWSVWFDRITGTPSATGIISISNRQAVATSTIEIFKSGLIQSE